MFKHNPFLRLVQNPLDFESLLVLIRNRRHCSLKAHYSSKATGKGRILDVVIDGLNRFNIAQKDDFSRPHRLCENHFSSVIISRRSEILAVMQQADFRNAHRVDGGRLSNPLQAVFSAPGGGKSRFLDMLADHVHGLTSSSSCLYGSTVLTTSYNGITGTPSTVDKELKMSPSFGLGARILWSHFVLKGRIHQFGKFCQYLQTAAPDLNHLNAVMAVYEHQSSDRILLLVDELIKTEEVSGAWPRYILSCIGDLLDDFAGFNAVVTSLKPGPILRLHSLSGRPVEWVPLPPFTLQESIKIMEPTSTKHAYLGYGDVMKLCISDVGGHPRGLEVLKAAFDKYLTPNMQNADIMAAVVSEFKRGFTLSSLTSEVVKLALRGAIVDLEEPVGRFKVEELIAEGTFLNTEAGMSVIAVVPRLSIMLLRVFCARLGTEKAERDLKKCIAETALRSDPSFDFNDMELFHARWEVLVRLVGSTGPMTLSEFYGRVEFTNMPKAAVEVSIDFCAKTEGVISWHDKRSIFGGFTGKPSCRAVYLAKHGQAGFDMVLFEARTGGGHVAIFIDTKYSTPESTTRLKSDEPAKKWQHCLSWCADSEAARALGVGPEDCFLVIASWRCGDPEAIRAKEARDDKSRTVVLGRADLMRLYTPTLVSQPHFIMGEQLVRVEEADGECAG